MVIQQFMVGVKYSGVIEYIRLKYPDNYYELAHRIDKNTSGLLLIAKNKKSLINIQKHFVSNSIKKEYIAVSYNKTNNAIREKFSVNHPILKKKKRMIDLVRYQSKEKRVFHRFI